jgi:Ribosomal proteins 50S-L15, 50S-L18e, 60S-L27A
LLKKNGLIRSIRKDVKLLGTGELTKKLTIVVHSASATAQEKVSAAGGTLTLLKEPKVKKARKRKAAPKKVDETTDVEEAVVTDDAPVAEAEVAADEPETAADEQEGEE